MLWLIYPLIETPPPIIHFYVRLFVPTATKVVVATMQSLVFLLCSSGLCVTNCLVWRVYLCSNTVVTGWNKQTSICHPFLLKGPI